MTQISQMFWGFCLTQNWGEQNSDNKFQTFSMFYSFLELFQIISLLTIYLVDSQQYFLCIVAPQSVNQCLDS